MNFQFYIDKTGEIGIVEELHQAVVYVRGLPTAKPKELISFEDGSWGQVLSLTKDSVQVLMYTPANFEVGTRAARTDSVLQVPVGNELLGNTLTPLGILNKPFKAKEFRQVDPPPRTIMERAPVTEFMETGMPIVDLIVPIGKGQRELVIGDRKTGKTSFVLNILTNYAKKENSVCVYGGVGKRRNDLVYANQFFIANGVRDKIVMIDTTSADPPGIVYMAPYAAMSVAEYFSDQGFDVLVVLDDLTTHARSYREMTLLAGRFPGRNSYPGDVFYLHSKLLERAGNFKTGSITALPIADSIQGDLSGFIQTNIMAITDGHIYIDIDLYNKGNRPAVNPFLSVTRVGRQTQALISKDESRIVTSFLVQLQRLRDLMHFGAELSENVKRSLALGGRIDMFFYEFHEVKHVPVNLTIYIVGLFWAGFGREEGNDELKAKLVKLLDQYQKDSNFQNEVNKVIAQAKTLDELAIALSKTARSL